MKLANRIFFLYSVQLNWGAEVEILTSLLFTLIVLFFLASYLNYCTAWMMEWLRLSSALTSCDLYEVKGLNTEALRGLQGIRGIIAVIAPGVWVSEVRWAWGVSSKRLWLEIKIKEKSLFCQSSKSRVPQSWRWQFHEPGCWCFLPTGGRSRTWEIRTSAEEKRSFDQRQPFTET